MRKERKFSKKIHKLVLKFQILNLPCLINAKSVRWSILSLHFDAEHKIFIHCKDKKIVIPEITCSYLLSQNIKIGMLDSIINEFSPIIADMSPYELHCFERHFYSFNDKREPVYVDNNGCNFYPLPNNLIIEFPYIMKWREFNL